MDRLVDDDVLLVTARADADRVARTRHCDRNVERSEGRIRALHLVVVDDERRRIERRHRHEGRARECEVRVADHERRWVYVREPEYAARERGLEEWHRIDGLLPRQSEGICNRGTREGNEERDDEKSYSLHGGSRLSRSRVTEWLLSLAALSSGRASDWARLSVIRATVQVRRRDRRLCSRHVALTKLLRKCHNQSPRRRASDAPGWAASVTERLRHVTGSLECALHRPAGGARERPCSEGLARRVSRT